DKGLLYLSIAIFVWVLAGCWAYLSNGSHFSQTLYFKTGNHLFSITNDLFLFLALCYADHAPQFILKHKRNSNRIIALILFMAITLVLAKSWVIQLANTPKPNEMMISFMDWSLVKITIPSKKVFGATIEFGSKTTQYINLFKFAIRRKYGSEAAQTILIGLG